MTYSALLRFLAFLLPAVLASCAKPAYEARGYASCVAEQYAGHYTSSGSIYQPQSWTAAHNTLPFGTMVKVKNNYNGRTVNVTVNDRFPYYPNRVINLSRAAAEHIQLPYRQLGDVTVTAKTAAAAPAPNYAPPPQAYYNNTPPPPSYSTPPRTAHKAPTAKKKPVAKAHRSSPAPSYRTPSSVPPPGYGTMAPPAGIPPPPPGYGGR